MELIERYLQAVGFWLPKAQRQDILAELSEDIRSQAEDKESELGRKLTDADVEEILKQRGSPIMVANRYLPQRHLIGPVLFPIYRLVLKIAWLFYFLPWLLVWVCLNTFVPSYRAQAAGNLTVGALHGLWLALVYTFASVTFAFAVLEKYALKTGFLEKWNPRKLPPLRDPNRIKRSNSISEIVALVVVFILWIGFLSSPVMVDRPEVRIVLAPAWHYYFWWIVILIAVTLATSCVNLLRPYWTRFRASVKLLTDSAGWAMFAWLCKTNIVAEIAVKNVPAEKTLQITNAINLWMGRSFPIIVGIGVIIVAIDVYRIFRVKRGVNFSLGGLAAICGTLR
ncbi:MAG TPA: DUF4149 domain-containing protein [Terriglobales bacterium]|jgi:hypothetical protein